MSTKKEIGVKGKRIGSQALEVIDKVINFMQQEAEDGLHIPLENYRLRVISATGIGKSTYQKVASKRHIKSSQPCTSISRSTALVSPTRKRKRDSIIKSITPEQNKEIRSIIYDFYITERRRPILSCIYKKIKDRQMDFKGGITTLNKVLKSIGFRWVKTDDNKKALMEKYDIRLKRIQFLKKIVQYRSENRYIVYTGETYIHSTHTQSHGGSDLNYEKECKKPVSRGSRLIIIHAGGENGFVPNGLLIFKSGSKRGDHHEEMNHSNFMKWVENQLIPNLPERSVLVVNNASYQNVTMEKDITSASLKSDMITWLEERGLEFHQNWTKVELYQKIVENKFRFPLKFLLDSLMEKYGHSVLRLPPYHPDLNPLEKIWTLVKNWVAERNITFKISDVEELTKTKLDDVGVNEWKKICGDVVKLENDLIEKEHLFDDALDSLRFTVNMESSSEESDSDIESDLDLKPFPMSDSE